jgi:YebC/PmpR family DNA-binding regulatory protein
MSGHSKWSSIKHKKAAKDAKKGKLFTKLIKELTVAARMGGGDPSSNPRLRTAVAAAKQASMPSENIDRAIKKGTGELEGVHYEEVTYEGYGPGGVAILVQVTTDNKNRTVSEIRRTFTKHGGSMGESGCVAWMFEKKGLLAVDRNKVEEEKLMEMALEVGAEDLSEQGDVYEILTAPEQYESVREALERAGIAATVAELTMVPKSTVRVGGKEALQTLGLMEELEDHDEVQSVSGNMEITEELLEQAS